MSEGFVKANLHFLGTTWGDRVYRAACDCDDLTSHALEDLIPDQNRLLTEHEIETGWKKMKCFGLELPEFTKFLMREAERLVAHPHWQEGV